MDALESDMDEHRIRHGRKAIPIAGRKAGLHRLGLHVTSFQPKDGLEREVEESRFQFVIDFELLSVDHFPMLHALAH